MFNTIDEALIDLKHGKLIVVCDDDRRENEGDLIALASKITPAMVNFMITQGKGLVCSPLSQSYASRLGLSPMVNHNDDPQQTAFTQSVDYHSLTTGISAYERCYTLNALANASTRASDLRAPGHIFPLIARDGGVLVRPGHTEAAVDLAMLCGAAPVAVICEIINHDGRMARLPELIAMSQQFNLKIIHIQDLVAYRQNLLKV